MEKIQIMLNSKKANRYINDKTTDCIFTLPQIELKRRHRAYISITNAIIPYSFYNVNETNNKISYILDDTITYNIVIPPANYNINTLIDALKLLMTGFTITYNSATNKLKIQHNSLSWEFIEPTTANEIIGLSDINIPFTDVYTFDSDIGINLFTVRTLQISSNNFIMNNIDTSQPNRASIITSIPINVNMGSIIQYDNRHNIQSLIHDITNINNLHIQILDQDGDLLDLNGLHWSINLLLTIE